MKTHLSKTKRPFRISAVIQELDGYYMIIKWLDTNKFETFPYDTIKPYV